MTRAIVCTAFVATMLMAAACGHSPPTRFFTLDPRAPGAATPASYAGPPLRVDAIHIPPALDRPELVRQSGANEIVVEDFAQWAAPLGQTARRALTQDLMARLPPGSVIFPDAPKPAGAAGLVIDILALGDGDPATLDASWTVLAARSSRTGAPTVQVRTARVTAPSTGPGPAAQADRLSRLLATLADRIAAGLAGPQ